MKKAILNLARNISDRLQELLQRCTSWRRPYVRAQYFARDKVFITPFWERLCRKAPPERRRRLKFFLCAIDLIEKSSYPPRTRQDPQNPHALLHRFHGLTRDGLYYCVQIRENQRTGRKDFISVFPAREP